MTTYRATKHPCPPHPRPTVMAESENNVPTDSLADSTQVVHSAVRVIPTHISIRQFSGSETDYTARQFLDLCEAAVINSSITENHDKITFLRSHLLPGSRALPLMKDIGTNYEVLKKKMSSRALREATNHQL